MYLCKNKNYRIWVTGIILGFSILAFSGCNSADKMQGISPSPKVLIESPETADSTPVIKETKESSASVTIKPTATATQDKDSRIKKMYSETIRDTKLEEAIVKTYKLKKGQKVKYLYNKIDLNNDNIPEIFVFLFGEYFSGSGGSSAVIYKTDNNQYVEVSKFTLVQTPVIVSNTETLGWKNLIMHVSGGGIEAFDAEIKFGENGYPGNPSIQTPIESKNSIEGTAIISDEIAPDIGLEFTYV